MKCLILFSGKNKKNIINLSSAENAQRVVKVKNHTAVYRLSRKHNSSRTDKLWLSLMYWEVSLKRVRQ